MISLDASAADRFGCSAGQAVAIETTVIAAGANDDVASRWAKAMEVHGDGVYTACGGQDSHDDTVFAFETCRSSLESMPASSDMTACLVKPHVVIARQVSDEEGSIRQRVANASNCPNAPSAHHPPLTTHARPTCTTRRAVC